METLVHLDWEIKFLEVSGGQLSFCFFLLSFLLSWFCSFYISSLVFFFTFFVSPLLFYRCRFCVTLVFAFFLFGLSNFHVRIFL